MTSFVRALALLSGLALSGLAAAQSSTPFADRLLKGWGEGELSVDNPSNTPDEVLGTKWKLITVIPLNSPAVCPAILKRVADMADAIADREAGLQASDGVARGHEFLVGKPDKPQVQRLEVTTRHSHELWGCTVTAEDGPLIGVSVAYPLQRDQVRLGDERNTR